jgi:hypothetical protein
MSFRAYLESHYVVACNLQREIFRDPQMIAMLHTGTRNPQIVKSWMQDYKLFQGITGPHRDAVVDCFLHFAHSHRRLSTLSDEAVKSLYAGLFAALFRRVPRCWMSATSKLLWCLYPERIVMYDEFVLRALLVMQRIDDDLAGFPRIGSRPTIKKEADIQGAIAHYFLYQDMVQRLNMIHSGTLAQLRKRHHEKYAFDIRIVDKLLWMIGNPKPNNSWELTGRSARPVAPL